MAQPHSHVMLVCERARGRALALAVPPLLLARPPPLPPLLLLLARPLRVGDEGSGEALALQAAGEGRAGGQMLVCGARQGAAQPTLTTPASRKPSQRY